MISIIVCSKNSESTIKETLDSIIKQSYKNLEIILVDGKSKDKTVEIFQSYKFRKKKIIKNIQGIYRSMNMGISKASGNIIFILNSDDKFQDENVVSSYLKLFKKRNCDLIYSKIKIYDKQLSKKIRTWVPPKKIINSNLVKGILPPHPGFVVKKKIYEKYGVFNLEYKISSDFDLMLRLLKNKKIKKKFLNKFTILMRHGGASSASIFVLFLRNIENLKILNYHFGINLLTNLCYLFFRIVYKIKQYT